MNGERPDTIVSAVDEAGQVQQVVALVKENKMITALIVFVLWQTGTLLDMYLQIQTGVC